MAKKKRDRSYPPVEITLPAVGVIDNHCHLPVLDENNAPVDADDPALIESEQQLPIAEHVRRMQAAGVAGAITSACELPSIAGTLTMAREFPQIWAAVAIHPNESAMHAGVREVGPDGLEPYVRAHHAIPLQEAIARVEEACRQPETVAVGETGLDYFRTAQAGKDAQVASFEAHIELAKALDKPMQIHDREAHADTVAVLRRCGAPEKTIFHCFSGDRELAQIAAEHRWYASFAGPLTFPRNAELREAFMAMPRELVLVETDSPYLTPPPFRGRPNAPYLVAHTVQYIAQLWEVALEEACVQLAENARRVYRLP